MKEFVTIDELTARVASRDYTVGIVGLGYVGIPLALTACKARFNVVGFDIDARRVEQINKGESFIKHIPTRAIEESLKKQALRGYHGLRPPSGSGRDHHRRAHAVD